MQTLSDSQRLRHFAQLLSCVQLATLKVTVPLKCQVASPQVAARKRAEPLKVCKHALGLQAPALAGSCQVVTCVERRAPPAQRGFSSRPPLRNNPASVLRGMIPAPTPPLQAGTASSDPPVSAGPLPAAARQRPRGYI